MSTAAPRQKSIHELDPIETGGVEARQGFGFQDHVAAAFCIEKLKDPSLTQVWCESQDDITLIWSNGSCESVEFVQVKSNEPNQLWSIAMLCERDPKKKQADKVGTSILERSLAYDRCKEPCRFRIVTTRPVKDELKILTHALESVHRQGAVDEIDKLIGKVTGYVGDYVSINGRCCSFWVSVATWQELHSTESVKDRNVLELQRFVRNSGSVLFPDQAEELYNKLLFKVQEAAVAPHKASPDIKKFRRETTIAWLRMEIDNIEHPVAPGSGRTLREKMEKAGIPSDVIDNALRMRQQYRMEILTSQYQESNSRKAVDRGIAALLQLLLSKFDAGQLGDSGVAFHAHCLEKLGELPRTLKIFPTPKLDYLFGCMYNITDRCSHRFGRPAG